MADNFKRRVAIIGGVRTPFCRSNTLYAELTNLDLMTTVLQGLADRYHLNGVHIDEVVGGAVVTHAKDWNLAREAVIGTKLAPSTPGITMIQACGTSLQAAMGSAAKIACGEIDCAIAVGSDTTSDPPVVFRRSMARKLAAAGRSRSTMELVKTLASVRPGDLAPMAPSTSEPRTGLAMGEHCELMARQWRIPRVEQDALQPSTVDRHLRPLIAGIDATRFLPDTLAQLVEVQQFKGEDATLGDALQEPELVKFPDRMGQQVDADTEFAQFANRFVDARLVTLLMQKQRGGQAADTRADNRDVHRTSKTWRSTSAARRAPEATQTMRLSQA